MNIYNDMNTLSETCLQTYEALLILSKDNIL